MHTPPKQSPCPLHSKRARAAGRRSSIVPLSQVTVGTELSPRRNRNGGGADRLKLRSASANTARLSLATALLLAVVKMGGRPNQETMVFCN